MPEPNSEPTLDLRLTRDSRPLEAWLPELVSEERTQRYAAAEALGEMWTGAPEAPDREVQMERFASAVRETVERPEFPKASFVRRLLLYLLGLQRGWEEIAKQLSFRDEKLQARETRLNEQMLGSGDTEERERAARRFGKLFCASLARDERRTRTSEILEPPGLMASVVFDALDTALLEAGDLLREMLADRHLRYKAIQALERLGPAAAPFVPDLLQRLERSRNFDGQKVLGAIAQSDPALAAELVAHLRNGSETARIAAAGSLEAAGPAVGEPWVNEAIALLRELVPENAWWATRALASLGREREEILDELLTAAAPKPPRMKPCDFGSYDAAMYERGTALGALQYFTSFSERVVPVLVDAVETFEEYDPDWMDRGEHERVTSSLRAFGPQAAELAAPVLARYVRMSDGDVDWDVIHLLGEMGPAAEVALPALQDLGENLRKTYLEEEESSEPLSESDHPMTWVISRIRGSL